MSAGDCVDLEVIADGNLKLRTGKWIWREVRSNTKDVTSRAKAG
jgi:hypothetical protein